MAQPPPAGTSDGNGKKRKFDLDTDTLECPYCLEPFSIPVFQCRNGHSACSACCKKLTNGCPTCSKPIGVHRNAAIEKVIESLQVGCKHALNGCTTKLKYGDHDEIEEHENKVCEYRPLLCPFQSRRECLHIGPGLTIPKHLVDEHGVQVMESGLGPGRSICFPMKATCPMKLLKTDNTWLIVNCFKSRHNFGSFLYCTVLGSSKVKVLHKLSLERARLREEEKAYLTFTCVQAEAQSYRDLDLQTLAMGAILVGPYLNVPHEDHEWSEVEFDLKVTVL